MKQLEGWKVLGDGVRFIAGANPLIVHGKSSFEKSGAAKHFPVGVRFSEFQTNPHLEDIEQAIALFKEQQCDSVIGVGGGTAMDIAKSVALLAPLEGEAKSYITKELSASERTIPLTLVPTTAGTGSEATHFAVVYIDKTKYSLKHPSLIPDLSILDPSLHKSLPSFMTACTGMDALSQAIEGMWSIHATEESKAYSRESIPLIMNNLAAAVNENTDEARTAMAIASNLAGKSINKAFTTAAHAVSYPMTSYFGVPHGLACALTLPHFLVFNSEAVGELNEARGKEYVKGTLQEIIYLLGASNAAEARDKILTLMSACGLPITLSEAGVQDIEVVIANGFNPDRVKNNPVVLTKEGLRELLVKIV